jgi:hypothetical protein
MKQASAAKAKCPHGRPKTQCKECVGSSGICEHNRIKSKCVDCLGASYCIHGKRNTVCKECEGASCICEHGQQRNHCKECNLNGYLTKIVGNRIWYHLDGDTVLSTEQYLGCSIGQLRTYLEGKFQTGMTWENHGSWQIDHIVPMKYKKDGLDPTIQQTIERLHYLNTQPMWAAENDAKGHHYVGAYQPKPQPIMPPLQSYVIPKPQPRR